MMSTEQNIANVKVSTCVGRYLVVVLPTLTHIFLYQILSFSHIFSWQKYLLVWSGYYLLQLLIIIAGAFFATTFPHQAIIGTLMGRCNLCYYIVSNIICFRFVNYITSMSECCTKS